MLNLNTFQQTKVYQEALSEGELKGKLRTVPKLVEKGMSIQEMAELLELDADIVREEAETMFSLNNFKKTKVYQEALSEGELKGKLKTVPKLVERELSIEEIADLLELDTEAIRKSLKEE